MKKKKFDIATLFKNNRFTAFFSLVVAIIIWLSVVILYSPEDETVINDVPITVSTAIPEKYGLEVFEQDQTTINIKVRGKRYIISELTAENFKVTASTNSVIDSGRKTLKVKVEIDDYEDYELIEYTPTEINVYFDKMVTKDNIASELKIGVAGATPIDPKDEGFSSDMIAQDGYICFADEILASSTEKISVKGAESSVSKVSSVKLEVQLDSKLTQTIVLGNSGISKITPINSNGGTLSYLDDLKSGETAQPVTVMIPVYKKVQLPIKIVFENAPEGVDVSSLVKYTLMSGDSETGTLNAAIEEKYLSGMTDITVTVDWSLLDTSHKKIVLPIAYGGVEAVEPGAVLQDNVKMLDEVNSVELDFSGYIEYVRSATSTTTQ